MTPFLARQRTDRNFERLYQKHAGDVYRYALVVPRNEADAADVTQTTFMNAYRAFANGERPRTPQNWLIAIAHNVCRQRFRQSQRRPNEVAFNEELAEAPLEEEERVGAEDIRRALGHLAFNQRAALVMRELEGRSYQEIAEILALSVSAVETLIFRARRALREQLEEGITCHEAELAISRPAPAKPAAAAVQAAAATPIVAPVLRPQNPTTDEKPFRDSSIVARGKHHGRPAVLHGRKHEVSSLPPSRVRGHNVKPTHPAKPAHAQGKTQNAGHHSGQQKIHKHVPPPPPPHGNGKGNGKP